MAKQKKTKAPLPVRHSTHIQETSSRLILERVIMPWMVTAWTEKDYGIDAIVELTRMNVDKTQQLASGLRFSLQLKSVAEVKINDHFISLTIDKTKISYWSNSIEPVILVLVDITSQYCFFRFIDEQLIKELFTANKQWVAQETVTLRLKDDLKLDANGKLAIEEYVLHYKYKRPQKTILSPGTYFHYSGQVSGHLQSLANIQEKYNITFFSEKIDEVQRKASHAIYTLAVAGPSRAGKSTLINAFLYKSVSPVGMLPTTGIPITIFPSIPGRGIKILRFNFSCNSQGLSV